MSIRLLTLTGAAAYGGAGPLLALWLWDSFGAAATAGVLLLWIGVGCALGVFLLVLRADRSTLGALAANVKATDKRVVAGLSSLESRVDSSLHDSRAAVLATIDGRILGLHDAIRQAGPHEPGVRP